MKTQSNMEPAAAPSKRRLVIGGLIFAAGQLVPLCVPFVARSALGSFWKTVISAVLLISPELFVLLAAAFLGKPGFNYLVNLFKRTLGRFFEKHGPPERVSPTRYRIGLVMFVIPIVFGWLAPYLSHEIPGYDSHRLLYSIPGDLLLIASLFVLGGEFWDKLRALFIHGARAQFPNA
ncbi:MAG: hypothetical protein JSW50_01140 [Candidatus Latescibacterota bacterium]|nr:MAG: hypothetical protein JSW50_01140 [Candidatus Latescibacterota bacterium]